jgi:hypothetical protein
MAVWVPQPSGLPADAFTLFAPESDFLTAAFQVDPSSAT